MTSENMERWIELRRKSLWCPTPCPTPRFYKHFMVTTNSSNKTQRVRAPNQTQQIDPDRRKSPRPAPASPAPPWWCHSSREHEKSSLLNQRTASFRTNNEHRQHFFQPRGCGPDNAHCRQRTLLSQRHYGNKSEFYTAVCNAESWTKEKNACLPEASRSSTARVSFHTHVGDRAQLANVMPCLLNQLALLNPVPI